MKRSNRVAKIYVWNLIDIMGKKNVQCTYTYTYIIFCWLWVWRPSFPFIKSSILHKHLASSVPHINYFRPITWLVKTFNLRVHFLSWRDESWTSLQLFHHLLLSSFMLEKGLNTLSRCLQGPVDVQGYMLHSVINIVLVCYLLTCSLMTSDSESKRPVLLLFEL